MAIIIHHNDDDGRCAGAIAYRQLVNPFDPRKICYEYHHGRKNDITFEIGRPNEPVFILDLGLDDELMNVIREFDKLGAKIVHIDHHKSTLDFLKSASDSDKEVLGHINQLVRIGVSGCLLTYVYANMSDEDKENISNLPDDRFDFTEERSHFAFFTNGKPGLDYAIPLGIRLIDDYDVWRHQMEETKYFNLGFSMEEDKSPSSDIWQPIVAPIGTTDIRTLYTKYIDPGTTIFNYQEALNARTMSRAFESEIDGVKCLCVNGTGNSFVFGDKLHEYPMCCLYYYTGEKWKYALFSSETADIAVDVSEVARKHGGGGHMHAAGFTSNSLVFVPK